LSQFNPALAKRVFCTAASLFALAFGSGVVPSVIPTSPRIAQSSSVNVPFSKRAFNASVVELPTLPDNQVL
jgi:hypothetical protein